MVGFLKKKKFWSLQALTLTLILTHPALAKRAPPPLVLPLRDRNIEYTITREQTACGDIGKAGFQSFLEAHDTKEKKAIWKTALYQRSYDCSLETDVQDIFVKSLKMEKSWIIATDEYGAIYKIAKTKGKLIKPLKSITYATAKLK